MSLTVTTARVRAKAGMDASYDTEIDALIAEQIPALEAILVATPGAEANLGATEIIAAELLDQVARREGTGVRIGELQVVAEGSAAVLRAQGWARLIPYRRDLGTVRTVGPRVVEA